MDYQFTFADNSTYLMHSNHKYIDKFVKGGKTVYVYAKDAANRVANKFMGTAEKARSDEMARRFFIANDAYNTSKSKTNYASGTAEYKNNVKSYRSQDSEKAKKQWQDAKAKADEIRNREKTALTNLTDAIKLKKAEAEQKKAYDAYISAMRNSVDAAKGAQDAEKDLAKRKQIENKSYANMTEAQTRARLAARRYAKTPYARLKKFFGQ